MKRDLSNVKHIVAVISGKGGVGKSTIAHRASVLLSKRGLRVGLLDADVHGPSLPTLTGVSDRPQMKERKMVPHVHLGVLVNSIGYFIQSDEALSWRGPMLVKAVRSMIMQTDWGNLDLLIVDMPPGTGDTHMFLATEFNISGAVVVFTPQALDIADAKRAIDMCGKLNVKILGMVQNFTHLLTKSGEKIAMHDAETTHGWQPIASVPFCQNKRDIDAYLSSLCEMLACLEGQTT